jgi:hypothetical protein
VRGIPRGPRPTTAGNAAQLTRREAEVLAARTSSLKHPVSPSSTVSGNTPRRWAFRVRPRTARAHRWPCRARPIHHAERPPAGGISRAAAMMREAIDQVVRARS